jgi:hypothetical protein
MKVSAQKIAQISAHARQVHADDGQIVRAIKSNEGALLHKIVLAYDTLNKIEATFGGGAAILAKLEGRAPTAATAPSVAKPSTARQRDTEETVAASMTGGVPGTSAAKKTTAAATTTRADAAAREANSALRHSSGKPAQASSKLMALVNESPRDKKEFWAQYGKIRDSGEPHASYYASMYYRAHARREWN